MSTFAIIAFWIVVAFAVGYSLGKAGILTVTWPPPKKKED